MVEAAAGAARPVGGTVAILGLGLVGGSLARDLHALGWRVLGHDRDAPTLDAAVREGCVRVALGSDLAGIEDADLVVVAVPVGEVPRVLRDVALRPGASVVTDVASTKRSVLAAAEAAGLSHRFVGAHPLAGDHRSGWSASRCGLFRGAAVFLCPARGAGPAVIQRAVALWRAVGAEPRVSDAAEHDRLMAWVSHLPQAAASALALALARSGLAAKALGPGGRDTTRLAASSPGVWTDILLDNADEVGAALAALEVSVADLRRSLERGDREGLVEALEAARRWKEAT